MPRGLLRKLTSTVVCLTLSTQSLYGLNPAAESPVPVPQPAAAAARLPELEKVLTGGLPSGPVLIHIQDAHGSSEAQARIVELLEAIEELARRQGTKPVLFLEGGAGQIMPGDFSFFHTRDKDILLARRLLEQGLFSGAELYLLKKTASDLLAFGIEDPALYRRNLKAYRFIMSFDRRVEKALQDFRTRLDGRAASIEDASLKAALRNYIDYHGGRLGFADYLVRLAADLKKSSPPASGYPSLQKDYPSLSRYLALRDMEPAAGSALKEQFSQLAADCGKSGSPSLARACGRLRGVLKGPEAGREARVEERSILEFYIEARRAGFTTTHYPLVNRYFSQKLLSGDIVAGDLGAETDRAAASLMEKYARSPDEKELLREYRLYFLLRNLFTFKLTRQDFRELSSMRALVDRPLLEWYDAAADFYEAAQLRDEALVKNMMDVFGRMDNRTAYLPVLVTGGYHAEGILALAEKSGFHCLSISPRLEGLDEIAAERRYAASLSDELPPFVHRVSEGRTAGENALKSRLFLPMNPAGAQGRPALAAARVQQAMGYRPDTYGASIAAAIRAMLDRQEAAPSDLDLSRPLPQAYRMKYEADRGLTFTEPLTGAEYSLDSARSEARALPLDRRLENAVREADSAAAEILLRSFSENPEFYRGGTAAFLSAEGLSAIVGLTKAGPAEDPGYVLLTGSKEAADVSLSLFREAMMGLLSKRYLSRPEDRPRILETAEKIWKGRREAVAAVGREFGGDREAQKAILRYKNKIHQLNASEQTLFLRPRNDSALRVAFEGGVLEAARSSPERARHVSPVEGLLAAPASNEAAALLRSEMNEHLDTLYLRRLLENARLLTRPFVMARFRAFSRLGFEEKLRRITGYNEDGILSAVRERRAMLETSWSIFRMERRVLLLQAVVRDLRKRNLALEQETFFNIVPGPPMPVLTEEQKKDFEWIDYLDQLVEKSPEEMSPEHLERLARDREQLASLEKELEEADAGLKRARREQGERFGRFSGMRTREAAAWTLLPKEKEPAAGPRTAVQTVEPGAVQTDRIESVKPVRPQSRLGSFFGRLYALTGRVAGRLAPVFRNRLVLAGAVAVLAVILIAMTVSKIDRTSRPSEPDRNPPESSAQAEPGRTAEKRDGKEKRQAVRHPEQAGMPSQFQENPAEPYGYHPDGQLPRTYTPGISGSHERATRADRGAKIAPLFRYRGTPPLGFFEGFTSRTDPETGKWYAVPETPGTYNRRNSFQTVEVRSISRNYDPGTLHPVQSSAEGSSFQGNVKGVDYAVGGYWEAPADTHGDEPSQLSRSNREHLDRVREFYGLPEKLEGNDAMIQAFLAKLFHDHFVYSSSQASKRYWNRPEVPPNLVKFAFTANPGEEVPGLECSGMAALARDVMDYYGYYAEISSGYVDANHDSLISTTEGHAIMRFWYKDSSGSGHFVYFDPVQHVRNTDDWKDDEAAELRNLYEDIFTEAGFRYWIEGRAREFFWTLAAMLGTLFSALIAYFLSPRRYYLRLLGKILSQKGAAREDWGSVEFPGTVEAWRQYRDYVLSVKGETVSAYDLEKWFYEDTQAAIQRALNLAAGAQLEPADGARHNLPILLYFRKGELRFRRLDQSLAEQKDSFLRDYRDKVLFVMKNFHRHPMSRVMLRLFVIYPPMFVSLAFLFSLLSLPFYVKLMIWFGALAAVTIDFSRIAVYTAAPKVREDDWIGRWLIIVPVSFFMFFAFLALTWGFSGLTDFVWESLTGAGRRNLVYSLYDGQPWKFFLYALMNGVSYAVPILVIAVVLWGAGSLVSERIARKRMSRIQKRYDMKIVRMENTVLQRIYDARFNDVRQINPLSYPLTGEHGVVLERVGELNRARLAAQGPVQTRARLAGEPVQFSSESFSTAGGRLFVHLPAPLLKGYPELWEHLHTLLDGAVIPENFMKDANRNSAVLAYFYDGWEYPYSNQENGVAALHPYTADFSGNPERSGAMRLFMLLTLSSHILGVKPHARSSREDLRAAFDRLFSGKPDLLAEFGLNAEAGAGPAFQTFLERLKKNGHLVIVDLDKQKTSALKTGDARAANVLIRYSDLLDYAERFRKREIISFGKVTAEFLLADGEARKTLLFHLFTSLDFRVGAPVDRVTVREDDGTSFTIWREEAGGLGRLPADTTKRYRPAWTSFESRSEVRTPDDNSAGRLLESLDLDTLRILTEGPYARFVPRKAGAAGAELLRELTAVPAAVTPAPGSDLQKLAAESLGALSRAGGEGPIRIVLTPAGSALKAFWNLHRAFKGSKTPEGKPAVELLFAEEKEGDLRQAVRAEFLRRDSPLEAVEKNELNSLFSGSKLQGAPHFRTVPLHSLAAISGETPEVFYFPSEKSSGLPARDGDLLAFDDLANAPDGYLFLPHALLLLGLALRQTAGIRVHAERIRALQEFLNLYGMRYENGRVRTNLEEFVKALEQVRAAGEILEHSA